MKNPEYIIRPYLYLSIILIPFILALILLVLSEFFAAIVTFFISILFLVPFVILRKKFFAKLIINDQGLTVFYKNNIIKQIKWEDIKAAIVIPTSHGFQISFFDHKLYDGKNKWKNSDGIFVNLNSNFALPLYKYINKLTVDLQNVEKLPKNIREKIV